MNSTTSRVGVRCAAIAVLVVACDALRAMDYTWTAASNSNWSTTTAWSPNGTPSTNDSIFSPSGSAAIGNLQINTATRQVKNMTDSRTAGTWQVRSGLTGNPTVFTISGTLAKQNGGTLLIRGTDAVQTLSLNIGAVHVDGGFLAFGNANSSNAQYIAGFSSTTTRVAEGAALQMYVYTGSDGTYSLGSVENNGTIVIGARGSAVSVPAEARMSALSGTNSAAVVTGLALPVVGSGVASTVRILGTADADYAGTFTDGSLGAVMHIVKTGSAAQTLSGSSSHTGSTVVDGGTLIINGAMASSAAAVHDGGTLRGDGSVASLTVADGGVLAPGDTQGIFTVAGNLGLQDGSTTRIEIAGSGRGAGFDGIDVGGVLSYGGVLVFDFLVASGPGLLEIFAGFSSIDGNFSAVTISGAFSAALSRSGQVWAGQDGLTAFQFDQSTGALTLAAVPEPGIAALLGLGLAFVFRALRRHHFS